MRLHAALLSWVLTLSLLATATASAGSAFVTLPGGPFLSALKDSSRKGPIRVASYELMRMPVTNAEFAGFVASHADWRRDRAPLMLAGTGYLAQWPGNAPSAAQRQQPVTHVSWFAAQAFCKAHGARLPTWNEWEYASAANETRHDARGDPAWRKKILDWYARPSSGALPRVGLQAANAYGVQDLHGLVWEWTDDFSSLLVSDDDRSSSDTDKTKFCGAGALAMNDPQNYAVLMHVAMLSSLQAQDSTGNLGFRCAKDVP